MIITVNSSVLYDGAYENSIRYFEEDLKTIYKAGKHSFGITYYGVEPRLFPLSKTVPDGLHERCLVAKTLMANLRTFIGKEDQATKDFFESHLLKLSLNPDGFFKLSHLVVWSLNKKFDCFTGAELGLFTENAAALADWMEKSNISNNGSLEFTSLCTALHCWTRIDAFLTIAVVQPSDNETVNSSVLYMTGRMRIACVISRKT